MWHHWEQGGGHLCNPAEKWVNSKGKYLTSKAVRIYHSRANFPRDLAEVKQRSPVGGDWKFVSRAHSFSGSNSFHPGHHIQMQWFRLDPLNHNFTLVLKKISAYCFHGRETWISWDWPWGSWQQALWLKLWTVDSYSKQILFPQNSHVKACLGKSLIVGADNSDYSFPVQATDWTAIMPDSTQK